MSKRKRKQRRGAPDWTPWLAAATRALAQNAEAIDATPRGTPGAKPSDWRRGSSPSSRE